MVAHLENSLTRTSTAGVVHVHAKTYIILACINFAYFAQLVAVVGSGFLAQSLQQLFQASSNESAWLSQGITILTVVLTPPVSQIADLWGRKWPLVICMSCGGIGAIVVSRAESMGTAIAGFCVVGISFGAQPLLHAVVSEILPRRNRAVAQGSINATAGVGAFVGLCMGGALLRGGMLERYRIYLYVTAALYFSASIGIAALYNTPPRTEQTSLTTRQKLAKLDWIGFATFIPGLVLFCVALSWSRNPYPWTSARVLAPFFVGVGFLAIFLVYEWRFTKTGTLHHGMFGERNFGIALFLIFAEGVVFFQANNYFAFQVTIFTGADMLIGGIHFGVVFLMSALVATFIGWYTTKTRSLRATLFLGVLFLLITMICLAATAQINPAGGFWAFAIILGAGLGILLPNIMVLAQLVTPPELIATASALVVATRSLGATIGLAIGNALFNTALSTEIPKKIAAATLPLGLPPTSIGPLIGALTAHNDAALASIPGVTPSIIGAAGQALVRAYGIGFRNIWILGASVSAVALVACLFIRDPKDEFTAHIDAPAEDSIIEKQARLEGFIKETAVSITSK